MSPKRNVHTLTPPEPVNMALVGNGVIADVISLDEVILH